MAETSYIGTQFAKPLQDDKVSFDASRSSSIYGKSTTVQPPAYALIAWRRTA